MTLVYEVDRPHRFSAAKLVIMMLTGTAGVAAALVTDFIAKGEASAILKMSILLNQTFNMSIPLGYLTVALLATGPIAVLFAQPRTLRAAFYAGASVLAVAMAGTPIEKLERVAPLLAFDTPVPEETLILPAPSATESMISPGVMSPAGRATAGLQTLEENRALDPGAIINGAVSPSSAQQAADLSLPVVPVQMAPSIPVTVQVMLPEGEPLSKMSARLHDTVSGQTWDLGVGRAEEKDGAYRVKFTANIVPQDEEARPLAHLYVRIEADGYAIAEADRPVSRMGPVVLPINLVESDVPIWLQRFNKPYKF